MLPHFDAHDAWRAIERHKVNIVVLIGDAMARPLIEALTAGGYDASSLFFISSSAALFSPSVKRQYLQLLPNVMITDADRLVGDRLRRDRGGGRRRGRRDGRPAGDARVRAPPCSATTAGPPRPA